MPARDAAEFKEAKTNPAEIEKIPDIVAQSISENWNGRVPPRDAFVSEVSKLACMAIYTLFKEGNLEALIGQMPQTEDGRRMATIIVAEALAAKNERLMLQCADIAFDLRVQSGRSENDIAEEHTICRATVSAICRQFVETYCDKPGTGMKSEAAVAQYSSLRKGRRAKPMPAAWEFAERFAALNQPKNEKSRTKRR